MKVDLAHLIDEIANRADELLPDVRNRAEARTSIKELVAADCPALAPAEASGVVEGVMAVLEHEDYFGTEFVGDPFAATEASEED